MAVVVTDNRIVWSDADSATNWSATATAAAADPVPVEATNRIGYVVGAATQDAFFTSTARALNNHIVYCWVFGRIVADTLVNGGYSIHIGDGTNRVAYHVAGDDVAGFRHESGPVGWQCLVLDTANLPSTKTIRAGSEATLLTNLSTSITQIGTTCKSLLAAPGMSPTYAADIIRILDPAVNDGCAITVTGGASGTPGKFSEIAVEDRSTGDQKAHGVIRELGPGVFGVQGPMRFGNPTGTASSWFEDKNVTIILEDRNFLTTRYKFFITDNGVGTTTFKFGDKIGAGTSALGNNGVTILSTSDVGGSFDSSTDTDVTDVFIYGSRFVSLTEGISFRDPQEWINNSFVGCGQINPNNAIMVNSEIVNSVASSALLWNFNGNTNGKLDGCSFLSPGTGHAIELGSNTPTGITFNNISFSNYGASGTTNAAVYNNSGKHIAITIAGGTIPTIRNGVGALTTIISGLVTITLSNLKTNTEVRIYQDSGGLNGTEIDGIENSSTSFSFSVASSSVINIIINNLNYLPADIWGFTVPSTDTTIPISQVIDRQYFNPA
jgi:hypothetical protein